MCFTVAKKVAKVKRNLRKPRGRKQKAKEADCAVKLLAELPFTSTEVWKELGCESVLLVSFSSPFSGHQY